MSEYNNQENSFSYQLSINLSQQNLQNILLPSKTMKRRSTKLDTRSTVQTNINKLSSNHLGYSKIVGQSQVNKDYSQNIKTQTNNFQFPSNSMENLCQISNSFKMYSKRFINFNETVLGLKCLGIDFQHQRKFEQVKIIFDEVKNARNNDSIDQEQFTIISIKLLAQEKNKYNSVLNSIYKAYYYMVLQANCIQQKSNVLRGSYQKQYEGFKNYVDRLGYQDMYLTKQSLLRLVKYLNLENQFTCSDISMISEDLDTQNKGYLNFQDCVRSVFINQIMQESQ